MWGFIFPLGAADPEVYLRRRRSSEVCWNAK
jgi:hypothetical protein